MLSREDNRRLAQLERQVRRDDPDFYARMLAGAPRRRRMPILLTLLAVAVWVTTLILAFSGWWVTAALTATGATLTVVVIVYRMLPIRAPGQA